MKRTAAPKEALPASAPDPELAWAAIDAVALPVPGISEQLSPEEQSALYATIYEDLRKRARSLLGAHHAGSLNTTGLVHEAFLKIADSNPKVASRAHFFNLASLVMRQIMVNRAKYRSMQKRDYQMAVSIDEELPNNDEHNLTNVLIIDQCLQRLHAQHPRVAKVVELHFFAGLSFREIAELYHLSITTVERDWRLARALINERLLPAGTGAEN
jgi:RNA polymerase sigma factor (TIGR02999 family)